MSSTRAAIRTTSNSIRPSRAELNRLVDETAKTLAARGLIHLTAEDARSDGRHVRLGGRDFVNFGSCSYLGLELDERLKEGACEAIRRYGVQFSSSRAYVSTPLYGEFEELLEQILGAPVVVTQTTSLGHLAVVPVVVGENDAVLYDVLVHASVQAVLPTLRAASISCTQLPHNRVDHLEEAIIQLEQEHDKIWYLCDGIYSMHGDRAPLAELLEVQARHASLHLYIDDAHGMSWTGRRGSGTVLGTGPIPARTVVALGFRRHLLRREPRSCFPMTHSAEWSGAAEAR